MIILKTDKNQSGFTIIELIVSIGLAGLLSVLMLTIFIYSYGGLLIEQSRANIVLESQLFLKRMTEDIRVANQVLSTNTITDANGGPWVTSDPANILILTQPAVDTDKEFIYDTATGYPYQNEIVYFGSGGSMFRRTLKNESATGNIAQTTCPNGAVGCSRDVPITENLKNMNFVFYDINNTVTTTISDARTVELTVNLEKKIFGRTISTQNTTRMALRNEN